MKITGAEVIKNGERELIDTITADLDWRTIEKIFKEKHRLGIDEDVEFKNGDVVVHDDQIAYQFEFDVKVTLSVLLDREGNYISVASSDELDEDQDEEQDAPAEELKAPSPPDEVAESGSGLEEVMAELDSSDDIEDNEILSTDAAQNDSENRIARVASEAADMLAKIDHEA